MKARINWDGDAKFVGDLIKVNIIKKWFPANLSNVHRILRAEKVHSKIFTQLMSNT